MSEYQYYEFRAVDRLLTQAQIDELRAVSSRARITPESFVNEYNWGDFKGSPDKWMEKYFDAFLYLANWGTRWLMFRVPVRVIDVAAVEAYCSDEGFSSRTAGGNIIFSCRAEEVEDDWLEGEGWLGSLIPLRSDVMHGDYRCLYLGWLLAVQAGELEDDELEPPVPPGLGALNTQLESLVDFLDIDNDLIAAAAEKSGKGPARALSSVEISTWIAKLPLADKDAVLTKLLEAEDSQAVAELRHRALSEIRSQRKPGGDAKEGGRRTVGQLIARWEAIREEREKREAERRALEKAELERIQAEERRRHLESLAGRENAVWAEVETLIAAKHAARYDQAVSLLKDLRDVANMKGTREEFSRRMTAMCSEHARKTSLIERFRTAKLVE